MLRMSVSRPPGVFTIVTTRNPAPPPPTSTKRKETTRKDIPNVKKVTHLRRKGFGHSDKKIYKNFLPLGLKKGSTSRVTSWRSKLESRRTTEWFASVRRPVQAKTYKSKGVRTSSPDTGSSLRTTEGLGPRNNILDTILISGL